MTYVHATDQPLVLWGLFSILPAAFAGVDPALNWAYPHSAVDTGEPKLAAGTYLGRKWLPGLGSNLGAVLIFNDLAPEDGRFNADCLTNSMHACTPSSRNVAR
jgi:hypothetical protein